MLKISRYLISLFSNNYITKDEDLEVYLSVQSRTLCGYSPWFYVKMNKKYINVYGSFKLFLIVFLQFLIQKLNNVIQVHETTKKRYCYYMCEPFFKFYIITKILIYSLL